MFFYGESRKRPLAPSLVYTAVLVIAATIFFINQGPMLLEGNGSVLATSLQYLTHHRFNNRSGFLIDDYSENFVFNNHPFSFENKKVICSH